MTDSTEAGPRPKANTAEYTAELKANRAANGLCADCPRPVAVRANGKPYKRCQSHLDYDKDRWRGVVKPERKYVKRAVPIKTRAERRAANVADGLCACGRERAIRNGLPIKNCEGCLASRKRRDKRMKTRRVFCPTCCASGFHRIDCEELKNGDR